MDRTVVDPVEAAAACWRTTTGTLAVACSAGPDSLAALTLLAGSPNRRANALRVFHVDHGWRGAEAAAVDLEAVRRVATSLNVEVDAVHLAPSPHRHSESEARSARYAALTELARAHAVATVVTAHHADDQLETRLVALLRLSRPEAFRGIRASRPLDVDVTLVRPFLDVPRDELRRFAPEAALHDPTNDDLRHPRNALRCAVIPRFDAERLSNAIAAFTEAADALSHGIARELAVPTPVTVVDDGLVAIDIPAFARLSRPARHVALERAASDARAAFDHVRSDLIERAIADVDGPKGVPHGERIERVGEVLFWECRPLRVATLADPRDMGVHGIFGWTTLRLERHPGGDPVYGDVTDAEFALPTPGLRMVDGTRLVDALRRRGIPPFLRARTPILTTPRGVVWFAGMSPKTTEPPEAYVATEGSRSRPKC